MNTLCHTKPDWTVRGDVGAKLRSQVRRLLVSTSTPDKQPARSGCQEAGVSSGVRR